MRRILALAALPFRMAGAREPAAPIFSGDPIKPHKAVVSAIGLECR
jgi:hypothetical protein